MTNLNTTRTTESTDRMPVLTINRPAGTTTTPKTSATRIGGTARRILNALMRSLATPHI